MPHARARFLISPDKLMASLGNPDLVVLDCTSTVVASETGPGFAIATGETAFLEGHVPGAQFVDIERDLSVPDGDLMFMLPPADRFARAMARLGVGASSRVVLYTTGQAGWAARVWLMLRAFGFDEAAILDGGFHGWRRAGLPIKQGAANHRSAPAEPFAWQVRDGVFVSTADVQRRGDAALVNALGPDAFRGEAAITYGRPGRIPGSVNIPTASLVDPETGRYLDQDRLKGMFAEAGISEDEPVIAYCGAGIAASNVVFARILTGGDAPAAVYDGSLLEWASDPDRPLVTG